jgi:hypothetical protein
MREMVDNARIGAAFIFQDYGWFTCFWIPAFLALFESSFQLVASVDNTYAFQYRK